MSDAFNFGGNTPGMGTADPNLLARLWGYVHPQVPPAAGPQTGPAGPITPSGSVVSAVAPAVAPAAAPAPAPAATIPPTATASVPPAAAPAAAPGGSPFTPVYRPNADIAGGPLSRGGAPQMSALDLSHMFGGGQPAAAAPAAARVPILPDVVSKAPLTQGPQRKGMGWPTKPDWGTYKRRPPPDADF